TFNGILTYTGDVSFSVLNGTLSGTAGVMYGNTTTFGQIFLNSGPFTFTAGGFFGLVGGLSSLDVGGFKAKLTQLQILPDAVILGGRLTVDPPVPSIFAAPAQYLEIKDLKITE